MSSKLPEWELQLPTGMSVDGELLSLEEAVVRAQKHSAEVLSFQNLEPGSRQLVVIERIRRKPEIDLMFIGVGDQLSRDEAIDHVVKGDKIGRLITEIEGRQIRIAMEILREEIAEGEVGSDQQASGSSEGSAL